jgi:hypothetical protein
MHVTGKVIMRRCETHVNINLHGRLLSMAAVSEDILFNTRPIGVVSKNLIGAWMTRLSMRTCSNLAPLRQHIAMDMDLKNVNTTAAIERDVYPTR